MTTKTRTPKGVVRVESTQGRLRLRWTYGGKSFCLATGFPDTKECRQAAEIQAKRIQLDIMFGEFDITLQKYKVQKVQQQLTLIQVVESFIQYKALNLDERSLVKYQSLLRHFKASGLGDKFGLSATNVHELKQYLLTQVCEQSSKDLLFLLKAAMNKAGLETKPLEECLSCFKVTPKQRVKVFNQHELQAILEGFERLFPHYLPFVKFMASTGARTAECVGLRWEDLSDDCSSVWIGSSLRRGERKSTKTHKARVIVLSQSLRQMLLDMKPVDANKSDLVFTTTEGNAIHDNAFASRYWRVVLEQAGIEYRKPYTLRHTFVTRCLERGMSAAQVSAITGHSIQVMLNHYVGVSGRAEVPELI
jgi:integrase